MMQSKLFKLDDEQRSRIRDCLRKDSINLDPDAEQKLSRNIELSTRTFLEAKQREGTLREAHEALRQLWFLAHEDDCPVGQLRARLESLPWEAVHYLDTRAERVIPRLFPGERVIPRLFPDENADQGLLAWAKSADGKKLIQAIRAVSADGGQRVSRSRGSGKRSRSRVEPLVFGHVRGAGGANLKSGRRRHRAQDDLVMHLALDWNMVTDAGPSPGRSDYRGFGDLVHSVFQWLDERAPDQALRRFWESVKKGRLEAEKSPKPPA